MTNRTRGRREPTPRCAGPLKEGPGLPTMEGYPAALERQTPSSSDPVLSLRDGQRDDGDHGDHGEDDPEQRRVREEAHLEVHARHACKERSREKDHRREGQDLHHVVRSLARTCDHDVERADDARPGVPRGLDRRLVARQELLEALPGHVVAERLELWVREREERCPVGGERPP